MRPINVGKLVFSLVLCAVVFLALSFYADFNQILQSFRTFRWSYLPILLVLAFLNYFLRFLKWDYYLSRLDISLSKKQSFAVFMSGLTMSVSPGRVGELIKSYMVKQLNETPMSYSAPIVLAERFTDFLAIVILSAYGVSAFRYGTQVLIINTLLVLGFLSLITSHAFCIKLIGSLGKLPFISRIAHKLEIGYESTYRLMGFKPLILATIISVVAWFCECYAFYLVFKGFSLSAPLLHSTFVYAFSTLVGAVSMLPGGLGITEGSMAGLTVMVLKIPKHVAVASTFIIRICTLWFAVLVGILALVLGRNIFVRIGNSLSDKDLTPEKVGNDHA